MHPLLAAVAEVYDDEARLAARKAELLAEVDAQALYADDGARSLSQWIAHRCRVPAGAARHDVACARSLRRLPELAKRFGVGEVNAHHVAVICRHHRNARIADKLEDDESHLVDAALEFPFPAFKRIVDYWAQLADEDGADRDAMERSARRHLRLSRTYDGMWALEGLLDSAAGAAVDEALRRIGDELYAIDPTTTHAQRRADALVELSHRAMTAPRDGKRPHPLITVLVDFATFAGRVCELTDGTVVAPRGVSALLDQALIERAVFDGPSRVTDIGHQRRFTGALRRAIELRDRTCTHDHCDAPHWRADVDHIEPWEWGGRTTQENGRLLCPFHNHLRQRRRGPPADRAG